MINNLENKKIILMPITLEIIEDLLQKNTNEIAKIGLKADVAWPTNDDMDVFPIYYESLKKTKKPTGFETWLIIDKENSTIIGDIGFLGQPDENGEVEIGYGLSENWQGKGYGSEAVFLIMDFLKKNKRVKRVKAECLINNIASKRVLEKSGFEEIKKDNELYYFLFDKKEEM